MLSSFLLIPYSLILSLTFFYFRMLIEKISIGIRTGRGYLQHPDDFDIEVPQEDPQRDHDKGCAWSIKLFRSTCTHSVLVSDIYRGLYATKAFYKTYPEVCKTVETLTVQLREWKRNHSCLSYKLPAKSSLSRDQEVKAVAHITERLSYLNSVILINRMPIQFDIASQRRIHPDRDPLKHISATSRHHSLICLHAARDSLRLLDTFPWRDVGFSW